MSTTKYRIISRYYQDICIGHLVCLDEGFLVGEWSSPSSSRPVGVFIGCKTLYSKKYKHWIAYTRNDDYKILAYVDEDHPKASATREEYDRKLLEEKNRIIALINCCDDESKLWEIEQILNREWDD